jgi:hypothetical protein
MEIGRSKAFKERGKLCMNKELLDFIKGNDSENPGNYSSP